MAKAVVIWSVAAPLDRGWTRAKLEAWCDEHGLQIDRYADAGAWHIAYTMAAPRDDAKVRGPQCHAPGTPSLVLRWGEIERHWWE